MSSSFGISTIPPTPTSFQTMELPESIRAFSSSRDGECTTYEKELTRKIARVTAKVTIGLPFVVLGSLIHLGCSFCARCLKTPFKLPLSKHLSSEQENRIKFIYKHHCKKKEFDKTKADLLKLRAELTELSKSFRIKLEQFNNVFKTFKREVEKFEQAREGEFIQKISNCIIQINNLFKDIQGITKEIEKTKKIKKEKCEQAIELWIEIVHSLPSCKFQGKQGKGLEEIERIITSLESQLKTYETKIKVRDLFLKNFTYTGLKRDYYQIKLYKMMKYKEEKLSKKVSLCPINEQIRDLRSALGKIG